MWLLSLELDNQGLDLSRQLVGIAYRAFGAVTQRLKPVLLVTVKDLVAGLARNAELPAHIRHRLPIQETSDKAQTLFHHRTRFPRHRHLPRNKSGKCNPCVRYVLSPMSRAAQSRQDLPEFQISVAQFSVALKAHTVTNSLRLFQWADHQSGSPAFRSPIKYVASNKALIFGAPKGPTVF